MNGICSFTPRFLAAPEYVFALHRPSDQVAVLVRNRTLKQTRSVFFLPRQLRVLPFSPGFASRIFPAPTYSSG